jgi:uncharacterized protein (DUF488 family)
MSEQRQRETTWMIGHSNHPIELFLELLKTHGITTLVDVRSYPVSRWNPQFSRSNLEPVLRKNSIRYYHSPKLGGKSQVDEAERLAALKKWFPAYGRLCMMCSEGDYHKCHRHYLLAPILNRMGFQVLQILPNGELETDTRRDGAAGVGVPPADAQNGERGSPPSSEQGSLFGEGL